MELSGLSKTSGKTALGFPGAGLILPHSFLPDLKVPLKASSYRKTSRIRGSFLHQHNSVSSSSKLPMLFQFW